MIVDIVILFVALYTFMMMYTVIKRKLNKKIEEYDEKTTEMEENQYKTTIANNSEVENKIIKWSESEMENKMSVQMNQDYQIESVKITDSGWVVTYSVIN